MLDLHVHTCLSPCGELEMHPSAVVDAACRRGLDAIAVCDHNAAGNVAATVRAGAAVGLCVVAGMEIASEEEVHVVALLPSVEADLSLQARVQRTLPGRNDPEVFGPQVLVDEHGLVEGFEERLLIGATTWPVNQVVRAIHDEGGVAVAAHVDRERFGLVGQLGFVPPDLPLDALEVSCRTPLPEARARFEHCGLPVITASDAHEPSALGRAVTLMLLEAPRFGEIRLALAGEAGRVVLGGGRPMEDLSLHVLDIAQNGIEAGAASVGVDLEEDPHADTLVLRVRDDGRGMTAAEAAAARDPFVTSRTTRRVGLGLPLLEAAARAAGGALEIESVPGAGTVVTARVARSHPDRPPLGDLQATVLALIAGNPDVEIRFRHAVGDRAYEVTSAGIAARAGGASVQSPEALALLRRTVTEGEALLGAVEALERQ
jgi:signal transduction histidine kinase